MSDGFGKARPVDVGALGAAMSGMRGGFAELGIEALARADAAPPPSEPRHFRPAHPGLKPTAGWDPFDPHGGRTPPPPPASEPEQAFDALEAARAEGFAEGMAAAERMAAARGEADASALAQLTAALEALAPIERDGLAARLRQTVLYLVTRIVGETGIAPERLSARIDAAAQLLADSSDPATLRLNPADFALLEGRLPARVLTIADGQIERGGFRIETRTTAIEDGPAAWLGQLAAAIDRAPLPTAN
jgi:flagellar assembly protein FliH